VLQKSQNALRLNFPQEDETNDNPIDVPSSASPRLPVSSSLFDVVPTHDYSIAAPTARKNLGSVMQKDFCNIIRHKRSFHNRSFCELATVANDRAAGSTDRCNTFCELLSRRLIEQGLSRPFIELSCDGTELGLAVQGQIGATWKILAEQSVGVFV